jgi:hypothetical protein
MAPGSILRTHPNATIYLDRDSAAQLSPALRDKLDHESQVMVNS